MAVIYSTDDIYTLYGIDHFVRKYKFCLKFDLYIEDIDGDEKNNNVFWRKEPDEIVKLDNNRLIVESSIFREIGLILSGYLEKQLMEKKTREKLSRIPLVDFYEKKLFEAIVAACHKRGVPVVSQAFWPHGKKFAVCLTHDVDEIRKTYQYLTRSLRCIKTRNFNCLKNQFITLLQKIRGREPYWTFEDIMSMEQKLGVRSTFFFLNEDAKVNVFDPHTWRHYGRKFNIKDPKLVELIRTLHSGGWEVGLHGSFYSYKDLRKLKKEKGILEEVLGNRIRGIRQHNLNIIIPETWRYHEKIGLEYDTTLGFNDCVGFRWCTCFPFHPLDAKSKKTMKLLELPLVIEDIALFSYSDPWEKFIEIVSEVERYGGVLTLLWHHSVFNCVEFPGWAEMYKKIIEYCKNKGAWITSAYEIVRWWKMREGSKLEVKYRNNRLLVTPLPKTHRHFINVQVPDGRKVKVISSNAEAKASGNLITISTNNLEKSEAVTIEIL